MPGRDCDLLLVVILGCALVLLPRTVTATRCLICDTDNRDDVGRCYETSTRTGFKECSYGCRMTFIVYGANKKARVVRSCGNAQSAVQSSCKVTRELRKEVDHNITECQCHSRLCNNATHYPGDDLALDACYSCDYYGNRAMGGRNLEDQPACYDPSEETTLVLCPHGYCRKIFYQREDYKAIARACVERTPSVDLSCHNWEEAGIYHEMCHCIGDKCNGGATSYVSLATLIISIVTRLLT